jgi:secreted trypsin-like serine protease
VHLGVHNLTDDSEVGRLVVRASRVVAHENFDSANFDNDIGIIKLPLSVEATSIFCFHMSIRDGAP